MGNLTSRIVALLKRNNSPHEIAQGIAIGVFIGIMPLYGFHTALVIMCAFLIPQANKIALLLGTNISLPITVPFIAWAGYSIGRCMLGERYPAVRWEALRHVSWRDIAVFYYPLFLGSVVLGIACAIVFYYITLFVAGKITRKKRRWIR